LELKVIVKGNFGIEKRLHQTYVLPLLIGIDISSLIFNSQVVFDSKAIAAHGFLGVNRTLKGRKKEGKKSRTREKERKP